MNSKWDLIVAGGGTSGVAAAISAARNGSKVLIIEKNSFLGGTATGSLVTPMMKNIEISGILAEVIDRLTKTGNCAKHSNGNPGWFNPEMLKCLLDDFCEENNVEVLFDTVVLGAEVKDNNITSIKCWNKGGYSDLKAKYFIDATGDADLASLAGVPFESEEHQAFSLRFIMSNVDLDVFAQWLNDIDPDSGVTSIDYYKYETLLLTTAHSSETSGWKLRPYFNMAVKEHVLEPSDASYFQVFSIPGQKDALAFNCPRISANKQLDPLNPQDISYAYKQGRKQIRHLVEFCKKYLQGFDDAYVSQIAPQIGIRDSRRIIGKYKLTEADILHAKKFDDPVAKSDYPVDIHGTSSGKSELIHLSAGEYYEIPLESLLPENINNLLVVGRCISATFRAQASIRIQPNCWAMGEYAGKYVSDKINLQK